MHIRTHLLGVKVHKLRDQLLGQEHALIVHPDSEVAYQPHHDLDLLLHIVNVPHVGVVERVVLLSPSRQRDLTSDFDVALDGGSLEHHLQCKSTTIAPVCVP